MDFILFSLIFSAGILTHIIIGFVIGILMIIRILIEGLTMRNLKKILLFGIIPMLLTAFWLLPFLLYSTSHQSSFGYAPNIGFIFGFGKCCWGLQAGGIGILAYIIIPLLAIFALKKYWKNKIILFTFISLLFIGFLLFGGLRGNYPYGVDPVRFILPFSIIMILFIGMVLFESKLNKNKTVILILSFILVFGLIWNFNIINKNTNEYSYIDDYSRFHIMENILKEDDFPIKDQFTNFRFGTNHFIFGETINFFMPKASQTFGYQDLGMLNKESLNQMQDQLWNSENSNNSIYWLDWYGIKYFESEGWNSNSTKKFKADDRFKEVMRYSNGYSFVLFEYLDAKQIITLVDYANESSLGKEKNFSWERENPDRAMIRYNSIDENDAVLFKEFYHKSWKAKEIVSEEKLEIAKTETGFMAVYPGLESRGVLFYQSRTIEEVIGILLSLIGVSILCIPMLRKKFFKLV